MSTFGFSYLVKLLSLNERPQRTEIRNRLHPRGDGYDFHRSLRQRIRRYLIENQEFDDVLTSTNDITRAPERDSAHAALLQLRAWRGSHVGSLIDIPSVTFPSPDGTFNIKFEPDFGVDLNGIPTAIHVWNTIRPPLAERSVYAALSLLPAAYENEEIVPEDYALLSLQTGRLYRLSEATDHSLIGRRMVGVLDRLIIDVQDELSRGEVPTERQPTR